MTAFDAGSLVFKLQTLGQQVFAKDQSDAKKAVKETGEAAQTAAGQVDKLGTSTDATGKKAKESKAPLDEQAKATKKTGDESEQASKKQDQQRQSTEQQIEAAKKLSAVLLVAGVAVAAMVGLSVAKSTEFDAAMSNVRAATMSTAAEQRDLGEAALDAGADTAYSAREAADAQEELAKAGLSVSSIVGGSLNGALALAAAGQLQVARSAEIMATTLTQFGLTADESGHVADVLAAGAGKAQGSVDDLALALQYVGPLANQAGWSLDETAGTLAYFATQGIMGEKAGTSLRGVLASLQAPSAAADAEMKRYNISMYDGNGKMLSLAGVAEQLHTKLGGLTDQERQAALGRIFGNESLVGATLLYEGGADAVQKMTAEVTEYGYSTRQAAIRQDNLAGDVEKLGGAFDTALIRTGAGANDVLRGMIQAVTELVDVYGDAPAPIQVTVAVVGTAAAAMLLLAGGAVGARVKFLELQAALADTNVAMGRTAWLGAGAGLALTGIITVVGLLMAKQAAARAVAESYADTIEDGTKKLSAVARDIAIEELQKGGDALSFNWQSAADAAEKLGAGMDVVTDAALKDQDAIDKLSRYYDALSGDQDEFNRLQEETGMNAYETRLALESLVGGIQRQNDAIDEGIRLKGQEEEAHKGATESAGTAAEAYVAEADAVDDLNSQLQELIDRINSSNDVAVDAITANADYLSALEGLKSQAEELGFSLDETTVSGSANAAAMAELSATAREAAESQFIQDLATMSANDAAKKWNDTLALQKQAFIDNAVEAGYNATEVQNLADRIFQMPDPKEIKFIVDTATAGQQIHDFIQDYDNQTINVWLNPKTQALNDAFASSMGWMADGGIVNFANGGLLPSVKQFAQGGTSENHVAQFARAGEWRVWAEEETGGEAYIPLAPSKRARSEMIMAETADRLGGRYIPASAVEAADGLIAGTGRRATGAGGMTHIDKVDIVVPTSNPELAAHYIGREFGLGIASA